MKNALTDLGIFTAIISTIGLTSELNATHPYTPLAFFFTIMLATSIAITILGMKARHA